MSCSLISKIAFAATIIATLPFSAFADTITFKNGDVLSGEVTQHTVLGVVFKTSFGAKLIIPRGEIADIVEAVDDVAALEPAAGEASKEKTIVNTLSDPFASAADGVAKTIKQVEWKGEVNVGGLLQTGNTEKNAIRVDSKVIARREKDRMTAIFEYDRAEDDGVISEDMASLEGIYDYFWKPKWFINSNLKFEQDDISNIDLRTDLGLGVGYQMYEQDDLNLQYILGTTYIREDFAANGGTEEDIALSWQFKYDQKLFSDVISIFHNHELEVPFDDTEAFLFESDTGLKIPVAANLVGTAKVEFDWDNQPALTVKEDDTKYTVSLGYSW